MALRFIVLCLGLWPWGWYCTFHSHFLQGNKKEADPRIKYLGGFSIKLNTWNSKKCKNFFGYYCLKLFSILCELYHKWTLVISKWPVNNTFDKFISYCWLNLQLCKTRESQEIWPLLLLFQVILLYILHICIRDSIKYMWRNITKGEQ